MKATTEPDMIFTESRQVRSMDVDCGRRMHFSRLFALMEESTIAHTELLGAGRKKTLDRGYLWVIGFLRAKIRRLPVYDETITMTTWPGPMMHALFPRYHRILDERGELLVEASAVWVLMDSTSRTMAFPEKAGVSVPGVVTGSECPFPGSVLPPEGGVVTSFTPPYSSLDLNGHMNNTRYLDLARDLMPGSLQDSCPAEIQAEFSGEIRRGDTVSLRHSVKDNVFSLAGYHDDKPRKHLFRLRFIYLGERSSACET